MRILAFLSLFVAIVSVNSVSSSSASDLICYQTRALKLPSPMPPPEGDKRTLQDLISEADLLGYADLGAAAYCTGDYKKAAKEWKSLAREGNADAQSSLGLLFNLGRGVPQDFTEAAKLYREAIKHGNISAQYYLGKMYANGQGVPQDYTEAYLWLNLAAANGIAGSEAERDAVASKLGSAELSEAQRRSRTFFETNLSNRD